MKPWELVAAFNAERLIELARIVLKIRYRALLDHRPTLGDGPWGLGTRVHERMIKQLAKLSLRKLPWLIVRLDGLYISLKIDSYPIRIYRGPADNPKSNALEGGVRDVEELVENEGYLKGFEPDADGMDWFWLMAIETVGHGTPVRIIVQQANLAGQTRNPWIVPVDLEAIEMEAAAEAAADSPSGPMAKPPIEVDKATVKPKGDRRGATDERG